MPTQRTFIFLLFTTLLLASCTTPALSYVENSNALLIYARMRQAGAPRPQSLCGFIPNLAVWGDGRVVLPVYTATGERQVNVGYVHKEALENALHDLWDANFFSDWPPEEPNPSGAGFELNVNLSTGSYSHGWNMPDMPKVYQNLLRRINSGDLAPFVPIQARLMVTAPQLGALKGQPDLWPAQFDFLPGEVPPEGRMITGEPLAFVWRVLNAREVPIVRSGNQNYVVWLEIPEIGMPWFKCWPSPSGTSTPTRQEYPVPLQATLPPLPAYPAPISTITPQPYPINPNS